MRMSTKNQKKHSSKVNKDDIVPTNFILKRAIAHFPHIGK